MRIVAHPNVVDLRAFFYSNGDRVRCCDDNFLGDMIDFSIRRSEGRGLLEPSARICPGNGLSGVTTLCQA